MTGLLVAASLLVQSLNPVATQQVQPGAVSGRLFAVDGSTPAAGIRIAAVPVTDERDKSAVPLMGINQTDESGNYRLDGLVPGRYYIFAGLIEYPNYYPGTTGLEAARSIVVDAGATVTGIDFRMARGTRMTVGGKAEVPRSVAFADTWTVSLFPQAFAGGTPFQTKMKPDGSFTFDQVPPGTYRLTSSLRGSSSINVTVEDRNVADLQLPVVDCNAGVRVSGRLVGPSSVQTISLTAAPTGCLQSTFVSSDGSFVFTNVPAGTYRLNLTPAPFGWTSSSFSVDRLDLPNVEIQLPATISVKGRASGEFGADVPWVSRGAPIEIVARNLSGGEVAQPIAADGTFDLRLVKGRYRVSVPRVPSGYYVKSIRYGAVDVLGDIMDIDEQLRPELEVTLGFTNRSQPSGVRLSGRLVVPAKSAIAQPDAVILASTTAKGAVFESPIDADGAFQFAGVPPGRYNLETFPDNPAAIHDIAVEQTDVSGIEFVLPALVRVQGGIDVLNGRGTVPENVSIQFAKREGGRTHVWAALAQTGNFQFYLPEGEYSFSVSQVPRDYDVSSVTSGPINIIESGLQVKPDSGSLNVRVTLRPR